MRCRGALAVGWLLLAAGPALALGLPGARGRDQRVAVVVARYRNGPAPQIDSQQWVDLLRTLANDYFDLLTGGATTFEFTAVSGTLTFAQPLPDNLPADAPAPVQEGDRHVRDALNWAEQSQLDARQAATYASQQGVDLTRTTRLIVFTARRARACSTIGHWLAFKDAQQRPVSLSVAVVPELRDDGSLVWDPATVLAPATLAGATDGLDRLTRLIAAGSGRMAMTTVLHELGHSLGLLDAYREVVPAGEDDYVWFWSLMGRQQGQWVDAFNRQQMGWLPESRIATLAPPLTGPVEVNEVRLAPAGRGGGDVFEALRLSCGPSLPGSGRLRRQIVGPFNGLYLEVRTPRSTDRRNLDSLLLDIRRPSDGSEFDYQDGVVVSLCRENLPLGSTIVLPQSRGEYLAFAALRAPTAGNNLGSVFNSDNAHDLPLPPGIKVEVLERVGDEYRLRVHWGPAPAPDLVVDAGLPGDSPDLWLDSPANGWDTYQFPSRANDDGTSPQFSGDLPLIAFHQPTRALFPGGPRVPSGPPELRRTAHRLHARVTNRGTRAAVNVRVHVVVVERPSLIDLDPAHPETLLRLGGDDRVFSIDRLEPGHRHEEVLEGFEPRGGPFTMFLWAEPAKGANGQLEYNPFNQLGAKAVVFYQTSMGSPYTPVTVPLTVTNYDVRQRRLLYAAVPADLPAGWDVQPDRWTAQADPTASVGFEVTFQPPQTDKPPARRVLRLQGWASHDDSFIPIGEVPVQVQLGTRSQTTLAVKVAGRGAQLTGQVTPAAAGLPVLISIDDSRGRSFFAGSPDGTLALLRTTARGNFGCDLAIDPALTYHAVATFVGDDQRLASHSELVTFGAASGVGMRPRPRPTLP